MMFLASLVLAIPAAQAHPAPVLPPQFPPQLELASGGQRGAPTDPEIFCVYPGDAPIGDLIIILGRNFDIGALAFFDLIPSVPVFAFALPPAPKIGSFAWMIVPVPPSLLGGRVNLSVNYLGQSSDPVPFTIRLLGGGYNQGPDPELWCPWPAQGNVFSPIALFGFGFTDQSVPYFGRFPSLNLGFFEGPEFPLFGNFSVMITVVPPSLPGTVNMTVETGSDVTEQDVSFRIR